MIVPSPPVLGDLRLRRDTFTGTILVVEGRDDQRFWEAHTDPTACRPMSRADRHGPHGPGRGGVLETLRVIEPLVASDPRLEGVIGIVDADWDRLTQPTPGYPRNTFLTDTHDLETMLLAGPALRKILAIYGAPERIAQTEAQEGKPLREAILERGMEFGRLRWLQQRERPHVQLERSEGQLVRRFLRSDWTMDRDRLLRHAVDAGLASDPASLALRFAELAGADPWQVCNGHDLVGILTCGLKNVFGTLGPTRGVDDVQSSLLVASETSWLRRTQLGVQLARWCSGHVPFQVLGEEGP